MLPIICMRRRRWGSTQQWTRCSVSSSKQLFPYSQTSLSSAAGVPLNRRGAFTAISTITLVPPMMRLSIERGSMHLCKAREGNPEQAAGFLAEALSVTSVRLPSYTLSLMLCACQLPLSSVVALPDAERTPALEMLALEPLECGDGRLNAACAQFASKVVTIIAFVSHHFFRS